MGLAAAISTLPSLGLTAFGVPCEALDYVTQGLVAEGIQRGAAILAVDLQTSRSDWPQRPVRSSVRTLSRSLPSHG